MNTHRNVVVAAFLSTLLASGARADEPGVRVGVTGGASLLDQSIEVSNSRVTRARRTLLAGLLAEVPIRGEATKLGLQVSYGPYPRDRHLLCAGTWGSPRSSCRTLSDTTSAINASVELSHRFGQRRLRPWAALGTGTTWTSTEEPDGFEDTNASQSYHAGLGMEHRRARLELRGVASTHHAHPTRHEDDALFEVQVRVAVFPF